MHGSDTWYILLEKAQQLRLIVILLGKMENAHKLIFFN